MEPPGKEDTARGPLPQILVAGVDGWRRWMPNLSVAELFVTCSYNWLSSRSRQDMEVGRGVRIRTGGLLRPRQARYQAALRPDIFAVNQF
jgi:hypothetical protein